MLLSWWIMCFSTVWVCSSGLGSFAGCFRLVCVGMIDFAGGMLGLIC